EAGAGLDQPGVDRVPRGAGGGGEVGGGGPRRRVARGPAAAARADHPLCLDLDRALELSGADPAGRARDRRKPAVLDAGVELCAVLFLRAGLRGRPDHAEPDGARSAALLAGGAPARAARGWGGSRLLSVAITC